MNNEILADIQYQLEYEFDEPKLLRQAFTRKSYSEEHDGSYHNEVLEFYGDKALEFIVMKKLSEHYGELTQNGKY
ncbi:MAG: ribonuclease III, partial [Clostridia bacterium]|nr:ribonuclease III [Clostridia bacterium]